ncbi:MAG TPA: methyltransferase domain-containing protein, partial [Gaiellaceae bacterium]|nr:methyltransferase domain-containing protein [Gaiellaceae bacterium]
MIAVVCPRCLGELARTPDALECARCPGRYPLVAGIPDLRLGYPDPYVSWEQDVALARQLEALAEDLDFAGLLREHWRMSGKHPELAERFVAIELDSAEKAEAYVEEIEHERSRTLAPGDTFLEIGCGTAALATAAARRGAAAVASDISMRWLVLARKRLRDEGVEGVELVCCAAEEPPFPGETFDAVAASDVIEHTERQAAFVAGCARVL